MIHRLLMACAAVCALVGASGLVGATPAAAAPSLPTVEPGVLTVGTEGTYKPFSYEDSSGNLTGFDIDVAKDVAKKLGLTIKFVQGDFDGLFPSLGAHRFDIVANQISATPERATQYDLSDPYVETHGVVVTQSSNDAIHSVNDLRGKTSAQSLTSNFADIAKGAGATIVSAPGFTESISLLTQGRVQATVNDELTVKNYLQSTGDKNVKVAARTPDVSRIVMAARKDSGLMPAIDDAIAQLKSNGALDKTYDKYFNDNTKAATSWDLVRHSISPLLGALVKTTIPLTAVSFVIGLAIALVVALARRSQRTLLRNLARLYISIIRGTPLLVQLFIIFFALPKLGIVVPAFPAAAIALSLNVGGYAAEVIRSAIGSIDRGQWEASSSIGLSHLQTLRAVILPQAARTAIPPLGNTLISLVKDTSLASVITVPEILLTARTLAAPTYQFLPIYVTAAIYYWMICLILSFVQDRLEVRLSRFVAQ